MPSPPVHCCTRLETAACAASAPAPRFRSRGRTSRRRDGSAQLIFERLGDMHGFTGGDAIVKDRARPAAVDARSLRAALSPVGSCSGRLRRAHCEARARTVVVVMLGAPVKSFHSVCPATGAHSRSARKTAPFGVRWCSSRSSTGGPARGAPRTPHAAPSPRRQRLPDRDQRRDGFPGRPRGEEGCRYGHAAKDAKAHPSPANKHTALRHT